MYFICLRDPFYHPHTHCDPTYQLRVYQRQTHCPLEVRDDINSPASSPTPTPPPVMSSTLELLIELLKGIQSYHPNPKYDYILNYERLFTSYVSFIYALDFVYVSKSTSESMDALHSNKTWDILYLPSYKITVGC